MASPGRFAIACGFNARNDVVNATSSGAKGS
jgi:hypothetical protein